MAYGKHLLIDLWDVDIDYLHDGANAAQDALEKAVIACGATLLDSTFHTFDNGGFSGLLLLAESHISIHYWIEERFMSLDIFTCGISDPWKCLPIIMEYATPKRVHIECVERGK